MGSIISPSFIITAAHCVYLKRGPSCRGGREGSSPCTVSARRIKAVPLEENNSPNKREDDTISFPVRRVIMHPNYRDSLSHPTSDLALLEMRRKVDCQSRASPICLPVHELDARGKKIQVAGFGRSDNTTRDSSSVVKEGVVDMIPSIRCIADDDDEREIEEIFCSTGNKTHQGPCEGDSGSGVFANFSGTYFLLAIVSSGETDDCHHMEPNSDVNVQFYLDWIMSHVKDWPMPRDPAQGTPPNRKNQFGLKNMFKRKHQRRH